MKTQTKVLTPLLTGYNVRQHMCLKAIGKVLHFDNRIMPRVYIHGKARNA